MISERLKALRKEMEKQQIDAYIIPSSDPHQSEYVADPYKAREFITGFTGSAGTAVVTQDFAGLWTDGRYFIQGERQLEGSGINLFKMGEKNVPKYQEWLRKEMKVGQTIGFDGRVFSMSDFNTLKDTIDNDQINFNGSFDLVDSIWQSRPKLSEEPIFYHEIDYTGKSTKEKLEMLRDVMEEQEIGLYVLGALNDIAWLFNIRGNDVLYTPVAYAYAVITLEEAILYINPKKVPKYVADTLRQQKVIIKQYDEIFQDLPLTTHIGSVFLDPSKINVALYQGIPDGYKKVEANDLTLKLKACMNPIEIKNQKNAQIKDGVALVKFMKWLEDTLRIHPIDEIEAGNKLESFRAQQANFLENSFDTIAAYGPNAALMHYKAEESTAALLENKGFFLLDSGGQYLDGTTDITRTIPLGELTREEKLDYTLVLKGHIRLSRAVFLYGTTGSQLDVLARSAIWDQMMDYKSGTGHGVGYLLSVHEGPQRIRKDATPIVLEAGMVITNEPGIYKENKHGIRIENTLLINELTQNEHGQFMFFEVISFCPIATEPILVDRLSKEEILWLNAYHQEVLNKLSPYLQKEEKAWLEAKTRPIGIEC